MQPAIDTQVNIECGIRLYTVFCAVCGKDGMTEPESMHEMACNACGGNTLRLIRNHKLEQQVKQQPEFFMAGGGTFND